MNGPESLCNDESIQLERKTAGSSVRKQKLKKSLIGSCLGRLCEIFQTLRDNNSVALYADRSQGHSIQKVKLQMAFLSNFWSDQIKKILWLQKGVGRIIVVTVACI